VIVERLTLIGKPARSMNCRFYAIQHWLAPADRGWCRLGRDRRRCGHHRRRVHAVRCAGRSDLVALLIRVRIPPGVHSSTCDAAGRSDLVALLIRVRIPPGVHSSTCDAADRPCPPSTPATARKWVPIQARDRAAGCEAHAHPPAHGIGAPGGPVAGTPPPTAASRAGPTPATVDADLDGVGCDP
jgi:hypothetical protein